MGPSFLTRRQNELCSEIWSTIFIESSLLVLAAGQQGRYAGGTFRKQFEEPNVQFILSPSISFQRNFSQLEEGWLHWVALGNSMERLMWYFFPLEISLNKGNIPTMHPRLHSHQRLTLMALTLRPGCDKCLALVGTGQVRLLTTLVIRWRNWCVVAAGRWYLFHLEMTLIKGNIPTMHPRLHPHQWLTLVASTLRSGCN